MLGGEGVDLGWIRALAGIVLSIVEGCASLAVNSQNGGSRTDLLVFRNLSFVVRFFPLVQPHSSGLDYPQTTVRARQGNGASRGPGPRGDCISQRSEGGERDETALLARATLDDIAVQCPFQLLIGHGEDIEACLRQHRGRGPTEVLVELELHAGLVAGMSTYRSWLISEP